VIAMIGFGFGVCLFLSTFSVADTKVLRGTEPILLAARTTRHCKTLKNELSIDGSLKTADPQNLWLWWTNNWEPTWACLLEERVMYIGETPRTRTSGDGGKWVCDLIHIPKGRDACLVYSFGSHGHYEFEKGFSDEAGCEIHTFDPFTLGTKPPDENMYTHPWGLAIQDYVTPPLPWWHNERKTMRSLVSIVKELGHINRIIDVLKVDVDGVEFGIFDNPLFWDNLHQSGLIFKQLLIEIHFEGISTDRFTPDFLTSDNQKKKLNSGESIDRMLRVITSNGYVMFHKEVNLAANDACEYSFIKLDLEC
jgi:hypothetical protein